MNRIIVIILLFISSFSYGQGKIGVQGDLVPTGSYPIVKQKNLKGNIFPVPNIAARNAIPANFRDTGMIVVTYDTYSYYSLQGGVLDANWVLLFTGTPSGSLDTTTYNTGIANIGRVKKIADSLDAKRSTDSSNVFLRNQFLAIQTAEAYISGRMRAGYFIGDSLVNPTSVSNSSLYMGPTGVVIRTNVVTGNSALRVNAQNASNGILQDWQSQGTTKASVTNNGTFVGVALINFNNTNNGSVGVTDNGLLDTRNINDAFPVKRIQNLNAGTTGDHTQLLNSAGDTMWRETKLGNNILQPKFTTSATSTFAPGLNITTDHQRTGPIAAAGIIAVATGDAVANTYTGISPTNAYSSGTGAIITAVVTAGQSATFTTTTGGSGYKNGDVLLIPRSALGSPTAGNYTLYIGDITQVNGYDNESSPLNIRPILRRAIVNGLFTPYMSGKVIARDGSQIGNRWMFGQYSTGGQFLNTFTIDDVITLQMSPGVISGGAAIFSSMQTGGLTVGGILSAVTIRSVSGDMEVNGSINTSSYRDIVTRPFSTSSTLTGFSFSSGATVPYGVVTSLVVTTPGSGYVNGTYTSLTATGGTGTLLTLNITVAGGVVTAVSTGNNVGTAYATGDIVSTTIPGGGSGFTATITIRTAAMFGALNNISSYRSSNTDNFYTVRAIPTYNMVSGYTGSIYGFYYNPTITALQGGTHIAWENVTGDVRLGSTSGSVTIGTLPSGSNLDSILLWNGTTKTIKKTTYAALAAAIGATGIDTTTYNTGLANIGRVKKIVDSLIAIGLTGVAHLTGTETFTGLKTFSGAATTFTGNVSLPTANTSMSVGSGSYGSISIRDESAVSLVAARFYTAGLANYSDIAINPNAKGGRFYVPSRLANDTLALKGDIHDSLLTTLRTTGPQSASGNKTFTGTIIGTGAVDFSTSLGVSANDIAMGSGTVNTSFGINGYLGINPGAALRFYTAGNYSGIIPNPAVVVTGNNYAPSSINDTIAVKADIVRDTTSNAATLTIVNTYTDFFFNGTTSTWTMPVLARRTRFIIYNIGSGNLTINSNTGGNDLWQSGVAVNSIVLTPAESVVISGNGTYWVVRN
jgi:hypothetical protein